MPLVRITNIMIKLISGAVYKIWTLIEALHIVLAYLKGHHCNALKGAVYRTNGDDTTLSENVCLL